MEMAGAAKGAVSSLLGSLSSVLVDEVKRLWGVRRELQSIKDEMESMNSFLLDLEEVDRPSHQQMTWMRQVRDLAYSAEHCISLQQELILREGHRSKGFLGYLPPVHTLRARHKLAMKVRELNEHIKGVNERRQRYGVQIPQKSGDKLTTTLAPITGAASSPQAAGGGDEGIIPSDDEDEQTPKDEAMSALAFAEPRILEVCTQELVNWLSYTEQAARWLKEDKFPSIAIAAPDKEDGADVALEALAHPSVATKFEHKLWITFRWFLPATPMCILEEILGKLPKPQEGDWARTEELDRKIDARAKTEELDRKIDAIVKKTKEHLPSAGTEKSPRVVPLEPLDILCDTLQGLLSEPREDERAKTEELDRKIDVIVQKIKEHLPAAGTEKSPRVVPLQELLPEPVQSVGKDQIEEKINETAMKIKQYLEELHKGRSWIGLDHSEYEGILRELLPQPKENKPVKEATDKLGDDQIAKNIKEILQKLLSKPQEDTALNERKDEDQMYQEKIEEIIENIERILENIKQHLLLKEIVKKIRVHLEGKRTIIVLDGISFAYEWGETKRALNQLGCAAGSAVIVTTRYTQGFEEFYHPTRDAIIYSLVDFYYRKVLLFTSRRKNKDCNEYIFREILECCEPHELCMKLFAYALYANPDKSKEDLEKLRVTLVFRGPLDTNAKKLLMFSYNDLHRDYKTCFLYLVIFRRGHKISRSTLVGRWVSEGLITKEDSPSSPSSVHRAEQCFDELVNRWLVYPSDIGAAGKVKSCIVYDIVHEFITKIARKENFAETRRSHQFFVLSDGRLRSSDSIEKFSQNLHRIPQLPLVKVLDLEGCQMNQNYIKNICSKMLLLKYLSLRNTDISNLPKEINNLHLLEVLDIRQTHVDASATRYLMLPMLKRLLAGCNIDPPHPSTDINRTNKSLDAVELPRGIGKMTNMKVLSHVEASQRGAELKAIGMLRQLRKLGLVIHDKDLEKLVRAISDLRESLQCLSISIKPLQASNHGTPSNACISLENPPKLLENLSISGITSGQLLPLLVKHCDQLAKVTLHNTHLNQDNLKDFGQLPKLRCVRLRHMSYTARNLTFKNQEFQNLKYFLVEGSNMTEISFENGAAPELEKMVLSFTNIMSLRGVDSLPKLKEVELNDNRSPLPLFDNANQIAKVTLRDTLLKQGDLQILAKKPKMSCLMLLDKSCDESQLTFNTDEFPKLSLLVVECAGITNISFSGGAAPKLEKIVWSFTTMESLSDINNLPILKELELNGTVVPDQVRQAIKAHPNDLYFKHNKPQNEDQGAGSAEETEDTSCFPFFCKNKDRC